MFILQVMQQAGIEDEQVVLVLEDHQFEGTDFLELINSLLSAGEIPGLYTPEELEPVLAPLRDQASDAGFRGTLAQYFASSKFLTSFIFCVFKGNITITVTMPMKAIVTLCQWWQTL